jgi:GT2 family glycosyltransferase
MTSSPTVSVIVCAYTDRRWSDTRDAVASLDAQTHRPAEVLLVIDTNPPLAERARAELRGVRVLENEQRRGLSGARNTGVENSCGDIVAFLDDDAQARPDWLERLLGPYADPDVVAVGGAARPQWPLGRDRPSWLPALDDHTDTGPLDWVLGCTYTGLPTQLAEVRNLMGCNMSFRRSVFDRIGGFTMGIGRLGTLPLGCEETELCIRARQLLPDTHILFEPAAVVSHRVTADRMSWSYLRRRSWAEGVSKAAIARLIGADDALSSERRYVTRILPAAFVRELGHVASGHASATAGALALASTPLLSAAGYLSGMARHRRSRRDAATGPVSTGPTFVGELDVRHRPTTLPARGPAGVVYHHAQVLLRDGRRTLDIVRLPVVDGVVDQSALAHSPAAPSSPGSRPWVPRVTVVVPTADRPDAVRKCVKFLLCSDYPKLDVIVVDNRPASPDAGALRELADGDARIRYIAEPRPGVSRARNTGLAAATGELVGFVDDDIEVDRWWLANLVAELVEDRIDCATSLVLPTRLDTPAQQTFEAMKGFGQGTRRQVFGPELAAVDPLYSFAPGRFGPGGCALWRRSSVQRLGGFDTLLGPGTPSRAGEDLELFLRLARSGGSVVYAPNGVAWHDHGAEWSELRDRLRAYGTGLSAMFLRHLGHKPGDSAMVAAMVARRLPGMLAPQSAPALSGNSTSPPGRVGGKRLVLDEVLGLAAGPVALARSVWRAHRMTAVDTRPSAGGHP